MPHVSGKKLKREVSERIEGRLIETLVGLEGSAADAVLRELFTATERTMFAKRLAMVFMLAQDFSSYRISKLLNVSPITATRMRDKIQKGEYGHIVSLLKNKQNREKIWVELEAMFRVSIPAMGRGQWYWLKELHDKHV